MSVPQKITKKLQAIREDDGPLEVETDIDARIVVTDSEAERIFQQQGLIQVSKGMMKDLATLGIHAKGVGVLRGQRGLAVLTQQRLSGLMGEIYRTFMSESKSNRRTRFKTIAQMAQVFGYLVSKMTESQRLVVEMEGGFTTPVQKAEAHAAVVKAFMPGQDVTPGTLMVSKEIHVHTNQSSPSPTEPTTK